MCYSESIAQKVLGRLSLIAISCIEDMHVDAKAKRMHNQVQLTLLRALNKRHHRLKCGQPRIA